MPRSIKPALALAALGVLLAGCSEYLDRRETISLNGGNALATNEVTMMVDPWPRYSANRNIAFNGEPVRISPGHTVVTTMFSRASSARRPSERPTSANLLAE